MSLLCELPPGLPGYPRGLRGGYLRCFERVHRRCITGDAITLLDINNSVPKYIYDEDITGKFNYKLTDTFMGFHCGNTLCAS